MSTGTIKFEPIPKLDKDWQEGLPKNNPANVWKVWDQDSYYLWGARSSNITGIPIGQSLNGGGMAGISHGPTRGLAHPHYVGVNTMEINKMSENDTVFTELTKLIKNGKNIVIPIFHDRNTPTGTFKYSLGTGIGAGVSQWGDIQKYIFQLLIKLSAHASSIEIPSGVYWPDCRNANRKPHYPITKIADIQSIVNLL